MGTGGGLRGEIKQTRPFRSRGQEALLGLLRTTDVVRRHLGGIVEKRGITLQQYNVLRILRGAGREGLPTLEIGARMVERTPGVTRLVDRLVRKGLVRRSRGREDRREMRCHISPRGLRILADLDGPMGRADGEYVGDLNDRELGQLVKLLDRVRAAPRQIGT
jgi:DNA-binding MarR family transcriptional regulator